MNKGRNEGSGKRHVQNYKKGGFCLSRNSRVREGSQGTRAHWFPLQGDYKCSKEVFVSGPWRSAKKVALTYMTVPVNKWLINVGGRASCHHLPPVFSGGS